MMAGIVSSRPRWITIGICGVVAVVAAVLAIVHWSAPTAIGAPPAGTVLYRDDFSGDLGGWDDAGPHASAGHGGYYADGAYRYVVTPMNRSWVSSPTRVAALYPSTSADLLLGVDVRWTTPGPDAAYGLSCRATPDQHLYAFVVGPGYATIVKISTSYDELVTVKLTADLDTPNHLQASCTTSSDRSSVHLIFWVNGRPMAQVTDAHDPLLDGTDGVEVGVGTKATTTVEAQFDNFVATRIANARSSS